MSKFEWVFLVIRSTHDSDFRAAKFALKDQNVANFVVCKDVLPMTHITGGNPLGGGR